MVGYFHVAHTTMTPVGMIFSGHSLLQLTGFMVGYDWGTTFLLQDLEYNLPAV